MIVRTQEGWMKYQNSIVETISQVAKFEDDFDGVFHINHIADKLIFNGTIVTNTPDETRGRAVISLKQIRAVLNEQCKLPYAKIERTELNWYRIVR